MGGAGKAATKKEMAQVRVIAMEDVEEKVFPSDVLEGERSVGAVNQTKLLFTNILCLYRLLSYITS